MGLGRNDPWVESHIRPQQMWGQRSSRFKKRLLYPHTLMYSQARLMVREPPCFYKRGEKEERCNWDLVQNV